MKIAINNARVVDSQSGFDQSANLFVADGKIAGIGQTPAGFVADETIDAAGAVVCPGLIDLSARLKGIESELHAAVAGGVTTLVCPPDANPPLDEPELVERLVRRVAENASARVLPLGALTQGLQGERLAELVGLKRAGCIAFSQGKQPITDTYALMRALEYAATFGFAVWLQPEDYWLARNGFAHDGEVASRLGLTGIPVAAETIAIATLTQLAAETGVRLHLRHLSSAAGVRMVAEAQAAGLKLSCDVGIHHLHMDETDIGYFNTMAKFDPPLRTAADRAALRQAVQSGLAAVCSDHSPCDDDDKILPFGEAKAGATALELLLPLTLQWGEEAGLSLAATLASVTSAPAAICGSAAGVLAEGAPADLCLFDPQATWTVSPQTLRSRGKNSPLLGQEVRGRVLATLVGGQVVYRA